MATGIRWGFLAALATGFVVFLTMILTIFTLSGLSFLLSLTLLIGMMMFASLSFGGVFRGKRWGWVLLLFFCLVTILFTYATYLFFGLTEFMTSLIASTILLFAIAMVNVGLGDDVAPRKPMVRPYHSVEKVEPYYEAQATAQMPTPKKKAPKGIFVASRMASTYHTPKCDWVDNIKRRNKVWFKSAKAAKNAKMKPHECVK